MENLYKLYVSLDAQLDKDNKMKVILYQYKVSSLKNKYIEINITDTKKRISYDKLNIIQSDIKNIKHISYFVWLDNDNDENISKLTNEIKNKINNDILIYKKTLDKLESNLKNDYIFNKEIIDERY